jgi:hypothetical protein
MAKRTRSVETEDEDEVAEAEIAEAEVPAGGTAGGSEGSVGYVPISNEDVKTEQEKGPPDPVSAAVEPVKATTLEINPRQPYPSADG